jgi:hypothetical protein
MTTTQHTENQVVSKKPTLFGRFKTFINSKPVGCTYTTRELMMTVGIHENSTYFKRFNRNPHYTTALYQTKLKDWGCLTHVKRGIWKINGHIPEWFSTFHFEFTDSDHFQYNPRRQQCMYWQNLPADLKHNPWMDVLAARLRKAINKVDQVHLKRGNSLTGASNAVIFNDADTADYGMHAFESITFSPVAGLPTAVANVVVGVKRADDGLFECWVEDLMDINWVDGAEAAAVVVDRMGDSWNDQTAWSVMRNLMGDDQFNILKEKLCAAAVERTSARMNVEAKKQDGPTFADLVEYMKDTVKSSIEDNLSNIDDDVELDLGYDKQISVSVDTSSIAREIANTVVDSIECWMDDNGAE